MDGFDVTSSRRTARHSRVGEGASGSLMGAAELIEPAWLMIERAAARFWLLGEGSHSGP